MTADDVLFWSFGLHHGGRKLHGLTVLYSARLSTMHFRLLELLPLKALDTIGNCQRLASTVDVSKYMYMHKITNQ